MSLLSQHCLAYILNFCQIKCHTFLAVVRMGQLLNTQKKWIFLFRFVRSGKILLILNVQWPPVDEVPPWLLLQWTLTVAGQGIRWFVCSFCLQVMYIPSDHISSTKASYVAMTNSNVQDVQSYLMSSRRWEPEYVWRALHGYIPTYSCYFSPFYLLEISFCFFICTNATNPSKAISRLSCPTVVSHLLQMELISSSSEPH